MPRWCPGLAAFSIVFFVQQEVLTTATTLLGRDSESLESRRSEELLARGNVLDDKYFIPAIATISAFVLLSLVCLYFLGCCCNSRKMDEFHSGAAVPRHSAIRNSASYQRPTTTVNLNSTDASDNVSHPKTTPQTTPPAPAPPRLYQTDAQQQPWSNGNQWQHSIPPPPLPATSHGFQSPAHTAVPPSVMSVRHLNPTAASYQYHRESERSTQIPRPHIQPPGSDARRVSSMSSATSSTQIGSGVGGVGVEQAPYVYSPHQGNTLSYASSTSQSMVAPAWDGSNMPRMPTNENLAMVGAAPPMEKHVGQSYQVPMVQNQSSGPPAYIDDVGKGRHGDINKSSY